MNAAQRQSGFTLVAVIFLIVVIGGALSLLATLSGRSLAQVNQNLLQTQARLAAQAGLEWGTQRLVIGSDRPSACSTELNGASVTVPAYPNIVVTLNCQQRRYNNDRSWLFDLSASAEYGQLNNADYVWTEQHATLEFDN